MILVDVPGADEYASAHIASRSTGRTPAECAFTGHYNPDFFIMITVLSINFLGDALRDLLGVRETKDLAHA